ncbi:MAG TPA: plastocyanin/azurin family copper-binding protein [Solirubrobacteraceae bacterium]
MRLQAARQATPRSISKLAALALLVSLLALAGCGSSSSGAGSSAYTPPAESTPASAAQTSTTAPTTSAPAQAPAGAASGSGQTLALAANPAGQLKYDKTSLTAKAGKVSIDFTNMSPEEHNMTIASTSGATLGATPTFQGASKTLTLNLKPGTYKFFCTVPGHRAAGMEGTLTVQ